MNNIIQQILDVCLGSGVLSVSEVNPDLVFLSCFLLFVLIFWVISQVVKFFFGLGGKFS